MVKHEKMGTTLRVAGGWVRDKLVGQEQGFHQRHLSKVDKMDIDIALDNCMGGDFATKLSRYLSEVRPLSLSCRSACSVNVSGGVASTLPAVSVTHVQLKKAWRYSVARQGQVVFACRTLET